MSALNKTLIGKHELEPKGQKVIFDLILPLLTGLRFFLGDGDFPLQNIQVHQCFQRTGQIGDLCFQNTADLAQFPISCGNCRQPCKSWTSSCLYVCRRC